MELWVVGQNKGDKQFEWGFDGVYDSEEKAIAACIEDDFFIAPTTLKTYG